MKTLIIFVLLVAHVTYPATELSLLTSELRAKGAFGFPQAAATVFCDTPALRFSVWNNAEFLLAQAVFWDDNDPALGKTEDNREIGDWSSLLLDLDGNGKATPNVDRNYSLNPWPGMEGLHYQIIYSEAGTSGLNRDSKGRGAIRYIRIDGEKLARVDTWLIPVAEIDRKPGDQIRVCYWGRSAKPDLTVNSAGYERDGKSYYSHHIPREQHHQYVMATGTDIDPTQVPEGRNDISLSKQKNIPMPKVGEAAPEISAGEWLNVKQPLTLAKLRGKVAVVEFWATWCGPCVEAIPHLNALHEKYSPKEFQLVSLVQEGQRTMDKFLKRKTVKYPIGLESESIETYGITGIPHAFVLDRQGRVIWHGHSASPEMERTVARELNR